MEIKRLTIDDLKKAIYSDSLWDTEVIPISKHRAISQVNNPRADNDDISLLIAYDEEAVIGYIGILPDKMFINNQETKFGWLTTWWVQENIKKSGIGLILLLETLKLYKQNIAVLGASESAIKVYENSREFILMKELKVMLILFRSNINYLLPYKFPKLKRMRHSLKVIDFVINKFLNLRIKIWKYNNNLYKDIKMEYICEIEEETKKFIAKYRKNELTRRDAIELNWIVKYPWQLISPLNNKTQSKYYFFKKTMRYTFLNVKVFDSKDEMIGFLILKARDNYLEIPYAYFDDMQVKKIIKAVAYHMVEMNIDVTIKEVTRLEKFTKIPDFDILEGHGGLFLVAPLDCYKVFSKEQFSD